MAEALLQTESRVQDVFKRYPDKVRGKLEHLRNLVIATADELPQVTHLEETLKWGEPSYLTRHGSTIRMDWKEKTPDQYALYFKCTSKLVPTFKVLYGDLFNFEGDRAIVFKLDDEIPEAELRQCIAAALQYHKVKKLPMLGMK